MSSSTAQKVILYRGLEHKGRHTYSPYVIKLELRLRIANIPYTAAIGSPRAGPKNKIPYVDVAALSGSDSPRLLSDSTLIAQTLVDEGHMPDLNAPLGPRDRAFDMSLRALCEDKLYFFGAREKWIDNYYAQRDAVMCSIPWPMRVIIGSMAYRNISSMLYGQGVGRFSDAEAAEIKLSIWAQLNDLLTESRRNSKSSGPFYALGGDAPTEADTMLFGFAVSNLVTDSAPESKRIVKSFPVICDYIERIHKNWFPDYAMWE